MKTLIPKESVAEERRVAATPDSVKKLVGMGLTVVVEAGAGAGSSYLDEAYQAAGATLGSAATWGEADLVLKLHPPTVEEIGRMKEGAALVSFLYPATRPELVDALNARRITSFAMDLVPRISRAQKMDALSSQSNIAGYKAVLLAANQLGKLFPMLMTAAGTITPARVVILGAGVAGLQAIATARRLGAVVDVSDIRPAVKEQVQSLGARFIEVEADQDAEDAGGYAKEASAEFKQRQEAALRERLREADAVITTALIPGRPAPRLISAGMVQEMREGAVIVDLAAEQGGNCELTKPGEVTTVHGVTILGLLNVPSLVAVHASDMYARNVVNFLGDHVKEGNLHVDLEDEVTKGSLVTRDGALVHEATAAMRNPEGATS